MRKRFEQQLTIGGLLIEETPIPTAKRNGALPALFASLKKIYCDKKWNKRVFEIIETKMPAKNNTGRPGLNLWQIFVLAQVRLCQNISYDSLHYMANSDSILRQLLGIETESGFERVSIGYQRIIDNVGLLDDEMVKELNNLIVEMGHEVFKKKDDTASRLKTDSFVVESNVHFPTDYNLLWDSARKCLDTIALLEKECILEGWRKKGDWRAELKNKMRALGRASASGGKTKQDRVISTAQDYLTKAKALYNKVEESVKNFPATDAKATLLLIQLNEYKELLEKHIDLTERRIIKGEKIPHDEKLFSIFEQYTEWVNKGKMRPNVELGKKVGITSDQYNLIVDYEIMENQADSETVEDLTQRILAKYKVSSWSFDKGYWSKENKATLLAQVDTVVLPKKGKRNATETEQERQPLFKKLRNKHSAVESNINELEHRGLNRCPDKGYPNFKKYVGLAVCAYNLKKIGVELIEQERQRLKKRHKLQQAA